MGVLSRSAACTFLSLLLLSVVLTLLPTSPVFGSTGTVDLGTVNNLTASATYTSATSFVNVTAGSALAKNDCTSLPCNTGYFAINFNAVDFSGSQFKLYLSTNGFSQINTTAGETSDVAVTTNVFSVGALSGVFGEIGTTGYYTGTLGADKIVAGPLPIQISNAYHFIKVYDGSSSSVATSIKEIAILPRLTLTPTSGPAGTTVTAIGGGFPTSALIELAYSYAFYPWSGSSTVHTGNWTTGVNTGNGYFSATAPMIDSKQAYNPDSGLQPISYISIIAKYQASPHFVLATATFNELTRVFTGITSYDSGGGELDSVNTPLGQYGNDTSGAGSNLAQPVSANVLGTMNIAGDHSMVNSAVTFWIGTVLVGSSTTNEYGHFNATIAVPILPAGTTVLKVINNGVTYEFNVDILPTLALAPSSGPVGTKVTAQAYGFPANTEWFLYWHEHSLGDATWYQIAHGTTGATGTFNVTVAFVVPNSYGGSHLVSASSTDVATSSPNSPGTAEAYTTSAVTTSTTTTSTTSTTMTATTTTTTATVTKATTITQPTTQIETTIQSTTITRFTTQTETTAQPTTTTTTTTTTSLSTSTASTYAYVSLGAAAIVILMVAGLAAWVLKGRRP